MTSLSALDLNLLRVFDAILRERSVSLAAERLNMTQPATSNALNRLRMSLNDQLFVRTRNGMEPTLFAQSIAGPVQRGLAAISASILQGMSFDPATSRRSFNILTTDVGEETYIAALMKLLSRKAPNIDVKVMEAPLEEYEDLLECGDADFAIGKVDISERFMREHIGSCKYMAILCSKFADSLGVAEGSVIPYDLYMSLPHVHVLPRVAGVKPHPIDVALGADAHRRRIALTLPHTSVLAEIIPDSQLLGTVPSPAVAPLRRKAELVTAELPFRTEVLRLHMIWHRRQELDRGHAWMRSEIRALPMSPWNIMELDRRAGEDIAEGVRP